MKASSRTPNRQPRRHLPFPAELRTSNIKKGPNEGTHHLHARKGKTWSLPSREEGDFREYYRLR